MPAPSLGTGSAQTIEFGIGSHLKFAEQEDAATLAGRKQTAANDFSRYNVAVNSMTVTPTSTLLTPGVIPITVEQFQGVPGPISIAGNFVIDALPKRMELFFRHLLNVPSANITSVSGDGIGDGSADTYLTAGTLNAPDSLTTDIDEDMGPVRLSVELSATATRDGDEPDANNPILVTIAGTDWSKNSIVETLTFTARGSTNSLTTSSYFRTVNANGITTNHTSGDPLVGTYAVSGTPTRGAVQLVSDADYRLTPGLTIEAVNGTIPNTITDAFINNVSWTASREENVTYSFGLTGRIYDANVNPAGSTTAFNTRSAGTGPYGTGAFASIQDGQTPFAGYGCCLGATIGGDEVNFPHLTGASLTIDNATQFTPRLWSIFPGLAYNRQRNITGEITLEYHSDDKQAVNDYLSGRVWDDVHVSLTNNGLGAPADETRFMFDRIQLTEYPSIPVESDDFLTQTIRFVALPSTGTLADAVTVRFYYQDGVTVSSLNLRNLS